MPADHDEALRWPPTDDSASNAPLEPDLHLAVHGLDRASRLRALVRRTLGVVRGLSRSERIEPTGKLTLPSQPAALPTSYSVACVRDNSSSTACARQLDTTTSSPKRSSPTSPDSSSATDRTGSATLRAQSFGPCGICSTLTSRPIRPTIGAPRNARPGGSSRRPCSTGRPCSFNGVDVRDEHRLRSDVPVTDLDRFLSFNERLRRELEAADLSTSPVSGDTSPQHDADAVEVGGQPLARGPRPSLPPKPKRDCPPVHSVH